MLPSQVKVQIRRRPFLFLLIFWLSIAVTAPLGMLPLRAAAFDPGDGYWDPRFDLPPGVNGAVASVVSMGRDVFVGGEFTIAGNKNIEGLARWDGKEWWP